MQIKEHNWIDISKCPDIYDKYFNDIKPQSKVDPQPDEPPWIQLDADLFMKFATFPYKTLTARMVLDFIIRATWGFQAKTDKLKLEKVCLTMSQSEIARQLKITTGRVLDALNELERANIILVYKHRQSKIPNIYFINKYYDTWNYGNSVMGNSVTGHGVTGHSVTDDTIEYDENDTDLGNTKAFPIKDGTRSGLLKIVNEEELNEISISATANIMSKDIPLSKIATVKRYEGMMFQEAKKIRDGK
jgi:hypothetical protein